MAVELGKRTIVFESANALENFYYSVVDFLKKNGLSVMKVLDTYNFSPRSQEWSFMTTKYTEQVRSANEILSAIGTIIRGLTAMKRDYQRVKECLDYYDKTKKDPDEIVLKGIWRDFVDSKTGPASLAQLARSDLQFFTIMDWFLKIKDAKSIDELPTNDRIKNILKRKFREYQVWKSHWKETLLELKEIMEERIKASYETINMYKKWVEPILRNVKAVTMQVEPISPELISIGGSVYAQVRLVAYKYYDEKKGKAFLPNPKDPKKKEEIEYVPVLTIDFTLRGTSPKGFMKTTMEIKPIVYPIDEFKKRIEEWKKDPIDEWIKRLMLNYEFSPEGVKEKEKKEESEFEKFKKSFNETIEKIREFRKNISEKFGGKKVKKFGVLDKLKKEISSLATDLYETVKKEFGMYHW